MEAVELEIFERGVRHAAASSRGEELDRNLLDLGWMDAVADDPQTAVTVLFECQGESGTTSSALQYLLARTLGLDDGIGSPVVLPALRQYEPPGHLTGSRCVVQGISSSDVSMQRSACVVVADSDQGFAMVRVPTSVLSFRPFSGIAPELQLADVAGDFDLACADQLGAADWTAAVSLGQLAIGHELVGGAKAMLELARTHALARHQFGRPISSFQAIRHRLADCLVAIERAAALLSAAWDDPSPVNAAMAKSSAGRGASTVARHCQQILAGIGFTVDHPFHRYLRRTMVLDQLFGSATVLTQELGSAVIQSATLPLTLPL